MLRPTWILIVALVVRLPMFSHQVKGQETSQKMKEDDADMMTTSDLWDDTTTQPTRRPRPANPSPPDNLTIEGMGHFNECIQRWFWGWWSAVPGLKSADLQCICMKNKKRCRPGLTFITPENAHEEIVKGRDALSQRSADRQRQYNLVYSVLIPTVILGVIGNLVLLVTIFKYMGKVTPVNMFISNLGVIDLITCIFCAPLEVFRMNSPIWYLGNVFCKFIWYMYYLLFILSVLTMVAISTERYLAIVHPMKAKSFGTSKRALIIITIIWIVGVVVTIPMGIIANNQSVVYDTGVVVCEAPIVYYVEMNKYIMFIMYTALFVIPMAIMTVMYSLTARTLVNSIRAQTKMTGTGPDGEREKSKQALESEKKRKQVVYMLIISVVFFLVCWGPRAIATLFNAVDSRLIGDTIIYKKYVYPVIVQLPVVNSCVNPILYGMFSTQFRQGYLCVITCGRRSMSKKGGMSSSTASSIQTMGTSQMSISATEAPSTTGKEFKA